MTPPLRTGMPHVQVKRNVIKRFAEN
jgi:hypothetical protein